MADDRARIDVNRKNTLMGVTDDANAYITNLRLDATTGRLRCSAVLSGVTVAGGGTGLTSLAAYAVLCGGITTTGAMQQVSGLGISGYVLTSNGAASLPTWQSAGANTALSNLASVAINTTLVSDTDVTDDLGTSLVRWHNLFVDHIGATGTRVSNGWFTDLTVTNAIAGSVTGSAATVTGAAQPNITSLGILTILNVDNLRIDGNIISSVSGDINITPVAGSKILLDGTVAVDAGQVTGITSLGITGTRVTAGFFTDLEVTNSPTISGVVIPSISSTSTLTNKRITPRILSAASYTTDTGTSLNCDNLDQFIITAQAGALLFNNPSGTATEAQKLIIRIKDNGTARALTYGTQFRAMGNALPTTTVLSKTLYMGFIFNITDTKWDLVAVAQEA